MFPKIALHVSLWGDDWSIVQWANAEEKEIANLRSIFDAAMNAGLNFWMADWSAYGKSEELLGAFLKTVQREDYYLSSEFKPAMSGLASASFTSCSSVKFLSSCISASFMLYSRRSSALRPRTALWLPRWTH